MNRITHPVEPEELMAYLDGELSADRATVAREHLSRCEECQTLVSDLRRLSQQVSTWNVPAAKTALPPAIDAALKGYKSRSSKIPPAKSVRWWDVFRKWDLAWVGAVAALFLIAIGTVRLIGGNANNVFSTVALNTRKAEQHSTLPASAPEVTGGPTAISNGGMVAGLQLDQETRKALSGPDKHGGGAAKTLVNNGPMVVRTADLSLITKQFDKARAAIENIVKQRRGYVGELRVGGSTGNGRALTATLRVPADQLDATLVELKALGRLESESQSGQDVTAQYMDLQARLANARITEQRLTDMLQQRTGKLSDVLEVEQEVDRVRGEIEQMEAERKTMSNRVSLATVNTTITEDYRAELQVVPPSTATRLSNAAVDGYRTMTDGVISLALFLLSSGPSLLLWGAVLFLPARFLWRKVRATTQPVR